MDLFNAVLTLLFAAVVTVNSQTIAGEMFDISGSGDFNTTTDSVDTTTTWDFLGDSTTSDGDITTEVADFTDRTTGFTEDTSLAPSEETTTSWDFSGDFTTAVDNVTTEITDETTNFIETTEGTDETTGFTGTTEFEDETTGFTDAAFTTGTVQSTETTEFEDKTTGFTVATFTAGTVQSTDGTTPEPGCPETCEYANSTCTAPSVVCVCDFGFIGQDGNVEPPCREPFCSETCIGEGQTCNDTDDCVCDETKNFELVNGICTKVCPDCPEDSTCYSPTEGCMCLPGYSGDGESCFDINECELKHPADCPSGEDSSWSCNNTPGSYTCACRNNFYYNAEDGECLQANCDTAGSGCPKNSTCRSAQPTLDCVCNIGYEMIAEECIDINECEVECLDSTELCLNTEGSFNCECIDGYYRDGLECIEVKCSTTTVACKDLPGLCVTVNDTVTFPDTLAGYTATSSNVCADDTDSAGFPFGTRPCSIEGQWGEPTWLSSCGISLESLANETVTDENRAEVSSNLEVLTAEPESLEPEDIDSTTEAIAEVTKADNLTDTVATSVVTTISNLMASPSIENSSDSGELVRQLDDIASKVVLTPSTSTRAIESSPDSSNFTTISGDIAIVVQEGLPGFGVAVLQRPETAGGFRSDQIIFIDKPIPSGTILKTGDRIRASIYVPQEASVQGTRSWVIVYGSNVLFQRNSTIEDTRQRSGLVSSNASIANDIILSAVVLEKNVAGLNDNISYSLPVEYGDNEEPLCAFWVDGENDWSADGCIVNETISSNGSLFCSCNHLTSFAALLQDVPEDIVTALYALDIITIVGCTISSIALIAVIFILSFCSTMSWRGKRYHASFLLVSLSVALLGLNITLLVSQIPAFSDRDQGAIYDSISCITIAIFLHFFMLSSCAWMNCEAVVFGIAVMKPLYSRNNLENKQVVLWSILWAILMPLLFVLIVALVDHNSYIYSNPDDEIVTCWLKPPDDIIYLAVIPTSVMIGFNLAVYVALSYYLCRTRDSELGKYWKVTRMSQTRRLGTNFTIAIILGLTWVFGFFMSAATKSTATVVFAYIFTISTSLQGLFILLVTVLRNAEMRKSISKKLGSVSNVLGRTTTQTRHAYNDTIRSTNDNSWDSQYSNTSFTNPGNPYTRSTEDETHHSVMSRKAATYSRRPADSETDPGGLVIENWRTRRHSR